MTACAVRPSSGTDDGARARPMPGTTLPARCRMDVGICPALRGDFPATTSGLEAAADSRRWFAWRLHWFAFRKTVEHGCRSAVTCTHIISSRARKGGEEEGKEGGRVGARLFCPPASAPNPAPDSPCVFGSATLGPLGENLPPSFGHTRRWESTCSHSHSVSSFLLHK